MTEHEQMVAGCEEREERLSEWERSFISSLSERLGSGRSLTKRQEEKLESIWDKATERG